MVTSTDFIGSCKSNYHTSTTTTPSIGSACDKVMSKEMFGVYTANVLCPKNGVNFALNEILQNNGIEVD